MASSALPVVLTAFLVSFFLLKDSVLLCSADPTDGFRLIPLTESNFLLQKPYNLASADRYSYSNGVRRLWVFSTDKPFKSGSSTDPRTEIRIKGYDYSSGVWQFEGYVFVPSGTSGASIMQIHRAEGEKPATDAMLRVYDGELRFYVGAVLENNVYNRWIKLNVIHDVDGNKLTIFVDGVMKHEAQGRGRSDFYFKFGVYGQTGESNRMESRWRDVKIFKK
ncbi:Citrate-binding protein [Platanthera zijinensis]|uniref:Citrate-binding protein n=1 Tax=Platanthera zijinensis TaxID=2320716 RepID=A0AAP0BTP6_9ASPA